MQLRAKMFGGFIALLTAAMTFASPLGAIEAVDLELVLAVDISRSISKEEAELQRQGYIAALGDPMVINAVTSGPLGRIALTYVEWAGFDYYRTVVDWSIIDGRDSAVDFATELLIATDRQRATNLNQRGNREFHSLVREQQHSEHPTHYRCLRGWRQQLWTTRRRSPQLSRGSGYYRKWPADPSRLARRGSSERGQQPR